jgi:glycosyltransferase involved in cell wall biosynthesis
LPALAGRAPIVNFGPTGPLVAREQLITIHDAGVRAVASSYGWKFRAWYGALLPALVRRSKVVMTVSNFSREQIVRFFGARSEQIRVTCEGWEHIVRVRADERILAKHGLLRGGYVLSVGSAAPHKNVEVLARAMRRLKPDEAQVVVVGAVNERVFADSGSRLGGAVRHLGYVTDRELRALYAHAGAFVFPSLYEGFGLPPLEAMALDCPVICSNAASLPEVCGDAALYFDPHDDAALADGIRRLLSDEEERRLRIRLGRQRLERYGWRKAARAYLSVIGDWMSRGDHLAGQRPSRRGPVAAASFAQELFA